jgi:hypothetical protein
MFWLPIVVVAILTGVMAFALGRTLIRISTKGAIRSVRQWERGDTAIFVFFWFALAIFLITCSVLIGDSEAIPIKKTDTHRATLAPLNPLVSGSYLVTILDEDGEPMIGYRLEGDKEGSLRSTLKRTSKVVPIDDSAAYALTYHPRPTGLWQAIILMGWQERIEFHVP